MGQSLTEDTAKFQADEALLQATDWGVWAVWITGGGTPGYTFSPRSIAAQRTAWATHVTPKQRFVSSKVFGLAEQRGVATSCPFFILAG